MAKFHGKIGYIRTEETALGVFTPVETERECRGTLLRNVRRWDSNEGVNDDVTISNRFSLIADDYAFGNLEFIRYILWKNTKWKVTSVDVQHPRLILTVGGVYNG